MHALESWLLPRGTQLDRTTELGLEREVQKGPRSFRGPYRLMAVEGTAQEGAVLPFLLEHTPCTPMEQGAASVEI